MKKFILILLTAAAFSCDGNRTSEKNADTDNTQPIEADTTNADDYGRQNSEMKTDGTDTTSTWDRDRDTQPKKDSIQ